VEAKKQSPLRELFFGIGTICQEQTRVKSETFSYDARGIANFLLDYADSKGVSISLLPLIKVIFYAHGWYLVQFGRPLVKQKFEAWEHGPVIRVLWEVMRGFGKQPIVAKRATARDLMTNKQEVVSIALPESVSSFLKDIFDAYGQLSAWRLSEMTHESDSPWDRLWNSASGSISLGMRIPDEEIRKWFNNQRFLATHQ
jgi:uncharacterized phage-associated protein